MRVLVAGVGDLFAGDDGFGLAVIERLATSRLPANVRLMSAGVRGFDLASTLLDGYAGAILVDAVCRGGAPGTLYVLEPNANPATAEGGVALDGDPREPGRALALARAVGAKLSWLRVVGCEPAPLSGMCMTLSPAVEAAVDEAVALVTSLIGEFREDSYAHA